MLPIEAINVLTKQAEVTKVTPPFIPISSYGGFSQIDHTKSKIHDFIEFAREFDRLWINSQMQRITI